MPLTPELAVKRRPVQLERTPPQFGAFSLQFDPMLLQGPSMSAPGLGISILGLEESLQPPPTIPAARAESLMLTPEITPAKLRLGKHPQSLPLAQSSCAEEPVTPDRPTMASRILGPRQLFIDDSDSESELPLPNPFLSPLIKPAASFGGSLAGNPFVGGRRRGPQVNFDTHLELVNHTTGKRIVKPLLKAHRHIKPKQLNFDLEAESHKTPHEITNRYINLSTNNAVNLKPRNSLGFQIYEDSDE